jgi:hypothetical protein
VEIVETAIDVNVDGAAELGHLGHGPTARGLLNTIVITLRNDL